LLPFYSVKRNVLKDCLIAKERSTISEINAYIFLLTSFEPLISSLGGVKLLLICEIVMSGCDLNPLLSSIFKVGFLMRFSGVPAKWAECFKPKTERIF